MKVVFTELGWEEFSHWLEKDEGVARKIKELIDAIRKQPFQGIGKPEPLKHALKGYWSRRISGEHRIVYHISGTKGKDQTCTIIQCRFHYEDK